MCVSEGLCRVIVCVRGEKLLRVSVCCCCVGVRLSVCMRTCVCVRVGSQKLGKQILIHSTVNCDQNIYLHFYSK